MISLTTDFDDFYSGQMKGIIYKINSDAKIIDITHKIKRHSIYEAAYVISNSYSFFPSGTIHVVVVDPGVGTDRAPIVIDFDGHIFVGPDNGTFSFLDGEVFRINLDTLSQESLKYGIVSVSNSFHGRDVFAPAAALLDIGIMDFLERTNQHVTLPFKKEISKNTALISVLYVDSFGNIILNLKKEDVKIKGIEVFGIDIPVLTHYEEGKELELIALYSSSGHLEISKYLGNANSTLKVGPGDLLRINLKN